MGSRLTTWILVALLLGLVAGLAVHYAVPDPVRVTAIGDALGTVTRVFLRLIKMIIAPLVFATLVAGIAHMGDTAALGRIGLRALGWFMLASIVSLSLGLVLVNVLQPGAGALGQATIASAAAPAVDRAPFSLDTFFTHLVPQSIVEAMANNEVLQIVVFSVFFGIALAASGESGRPLVRGVEALVQVMLRLTGYVMRFAPFAVFAAVAAAVSHEGPGILFTYGRFMGGFYLGLLLLWVLLAGAAVAIGGTRGRLLLREIRAPAILAFSTASSEAAFPRTLEALDRVGVPRRIGGFVLPLGYSFNLDGSMMYTTFATMFIAQAYGASLSLGQQLTMVLLLMVTSKGIAGVPRASLVVIAATLAFFDLPEAGLALIFAVDHFLDMGRSATNVIGNAVASLVVAKWEGLLPSGAVAPEGPLMTEDAPA